MDTYEKKYKDANNKVAARFGTNVAKEIFTDLYESEDERMMHQLHSWMKEFGGAEEYTEKVYTWLKSLLEKQSKQKSVWHNEDEEPQRDSLILLIMQNGTPIVAKIIEPNHTFNHGERWAYIDDLLEKQSEKSTIIDIDKMVMKYRYTKDGEFGLPVNFMIRAYRQGINDTLNLSLNIEKQGEQKPIKMWHDISEVPDEMQELLVEWESPDATWHDIAFYDTETKAFRHLKQPINNVTRWAYVSDILSQSVTKTSEQGWGDALERQGEQKPSDEDMKEALRTEYEKGRADAIAEMQKPWSEEDEWKFSDILALLRGGENCYYNTPDLFAWLKSFKERIGGKL